MTGKWVVQRAEKSDQAASILMFLLKEFSRLVGSDIMFNSGAKYLLECINKKYNKGEAVRLVAKHYNIPLSEVLTVGDSTNDIPLLDGEWHGVAVGDGSERLKQVAKEVTVDFKDKPVKYLLEKYCL